MLLERFVVAIASSKRWSREGDQCGSREIWLGLLYNASPKLVEKVWVLFWGSKNSRKCAISLQARLEASNG